MKKKAIGFLDPFHNEINDGTITKGILYKLKDYPFEALFTAVLLTDLHSYKLTEPEKKQIALCGAIQALGDVLNDDTQVSVEHVEKMLKKPNSSEANNSLEKFFISVYIELIDSIETQDKKNIFFNHLMSGFEAEKQIRKLKISKENKDVVKEVIEDTGGRSLLLYRSLIDREFIDGEEKALFICGSYIKFIDDIFDLYWDLKKDIQTSATECKTLEGLNNQLKEKYDEMEIYFSRSNVKKKNYYKFLFTFNIFKLGVEIYLKRIEDLVGNNIEKERLLSLTENEITLKMITLNHAFALIPQTLMFKLKN